MDNVLSHYESINELKNHTMCKPRFADLHTSNCCNQHCKGCAYSGQLDKQRLDYKQHIQLLDDLIDLGVNGFDFAGGGDPLLLDNICGLWDHLLNKNKHFGVITNGSLLTNELIDKIANSATYARISLEASDQDLYCSYKQVPKKMWDTVLDNIDKLVKVRNRNKTDCEISIKFSIGKSLRGIEHINNAIQLGHQLGVDKIQFKCLRHEPEELSQDEKEIENEYFLIRDDPKVFHWIMPMDKTDIPQCWLNPLHIVVDFLGDVYLCCYYYYRNDQLKLGNMFQTPLKDLWYSDRHWELISNINKNDCSKVDCKFFRWHHVVDKAFTNGRIEFL